LYYDLSPSWVHLPAFRPEILVEIVVTVKYVFAVAVKAFLASLALFLVLAVWRRFLTLQGCRREGSFGVAA